MGLKTNKKKAFTLQKSGFTLIEVVVTVLIFTVTLSAATHFFWSGYSTWNRTNEITDNHQSARFAVYNITKRIKKFNKDKIYLVEGGRRLFLWEGENIDYDIRLLHKDLCIGDYPYASNIENLKFSYKKIIFNENSYYLSDTNKEGERIKRIDNWDLIKVELVTRSKNSSYKLETFVSPKAELN